MKRNWLVVPMLTLFMVGGLSACSSVDKTEPTLVPTPNQGQNIVPSSQLESGTRQSGNLSPNGSETNDGASDPSTGSESETTNPTITEGSGRKDKAVENKSQATDPTTGTSTDPASEGSKKSMDSSKDSTENSNSSTSGE